MVTGPDPLLERVDEIVAVLRDRGVVLLPTDTVYGLAALPTMPDAVERIFELKGRRATVPIAVLCASAHQALSLAGPVEGAAAVAAELWPGPLTLVLPRGAAGDILYLGEPRETIGLRVPDHALLRAITDLAGPIAATSANLTGQPTAATAAEAAISLTGEPDLVVDGGRIEGSASTVIDTTTDPWTTLRQGPISSARVKHIAGR